MSDFNLGDQVDWHGTSGRIVGLIVDPAAVIEMPNGQKVTVGLDVLTRAPLPTAESSVIWAEWSGDEAEARQHSAYLVLIAGTWYEPHFGRGWQPQELLRHIDSFRIKAEPRAVTARAILDHIWNENGGPVNGYTDIAREYGLDS